MTLFNIFVSELKRSPTLIISRQTMNGVYPDRPATEAATALAEATDTEVFVDDNGNFQFNPVEKGTHHG
jgi:hypothetical protein